MQGTEKTCTSCKRPFDLRYFRPRKGEADGLQPFCTGCKYRSSVYRRLVTKDGQSEHK